MEGQGGGEARQEDHSGQEEVVPGYFLKNPTLIPTKNEKMFKPVNWLPEGRPPREGYGEGEVLEGGDAEYGRRLPTDDHLGLRVGGIVADVP